MHYLLLFLLLSTCWSCDYSSSQQQAVEEQELVLREVVPPSKPTVAPTPEVKELVPPEDSVEVPSFEVVLKPSSAAAYLLTTGEETFTLSITLLGAPKDAKTIADKAYYSSYDEVVYLLDKKYIITDPNQVFVLKEQISKEALDVLKDKNYKVAIDGFSSRKSSPDNIFHTSMLSGTISDFKGKKLTLDVRML